MATDPACLGGVMVVYLKTKHQTLAIANTYWPVKNALEIEKIPIHFKTSTRGGCAA